MAKKNENTEKVIAPVVTETEAQELVDAIDAPPPETNPAHVTAPPLAEGASVALEADLQKASFSAGGAVNVEAFAIEKCVSLLPRHGETGNLAEELVITIFNHDTVRVATVRKADRFTTQIATGATVEQACFEAYGKLAELKGLTV